MESMNYFSIHSVFSTNGRELSTETRFFCFTTSKNGGIIRQTRSAKMSKMFNTLGILVDMAFTIFLYFVFTGTDVIGLIAQLVKEVTR